MNTLPLYTKPKRKYPERNLQAAVVQHLVLTAKLDVLWLAIPNEGKRDARTGAHMKRMGLRPGAADLLIVVGNVACFLELKAEGGKQSPAQVAFQAECEAKGIPYAVATGIDEALAVLRAWGALPSANRQPQKVAA